ncbi:MAG: flagellar hook-basal body complex protein FliE [Parvularculaceae bacterium]
MSIEAIKAAQAYAKAQTGGPGAEGAGDAVGAPSFADMVKDAIGDAKETMAVGEATSIAGIKGEAELVDVVSAIASAEVTLETVVAVRDRVISAYQEIMRMPI